ncbi:MAG: toxin HicA, partial [Bacteriovoracia bacterium]
MSIDEALEALASDTNIKFKDLLKICENFFEGPKIKGSHHIFKTPWQGQPWVNIQKDGNKAKSYQVKQVR